jgi:hypothetical protein
MIGADTAAPAGRAIGYPYNVLSIFNIRHNEKGHVT